MKNVLGKLFGARAALVYLILFAAAIGVATFVENDFGTSTSQAVIYQSVWFELLLGLFSCALIYNVVHYRLMQRKQYATVLFHGSILIILLGSAITRNYGWEGMLHVREGSSSNEVLSRDTYLTVEVSAGNVKYRSTEQLFASSYGNGTSFKKTFKSQLGHYTIDCIQTLVEQTTVLTSEGGEGAVQVVFGGVNGRTELVLTPNDPVIHENVGLFWDENTPEFSMPFKVRKGTNRLHAAYFQSMVQEELWRRVSKILLRLVPGIPWCLEHYMQARRVNLYFLIMKRTVTFRLVLPPQRLLLAIPLD